MHRLLARARIVRLSLLDSAISISEYDKCALEMMRTRHSGLISHSLGRSCFWPRADAHSRVCKSGDLGNCGFHAMTKHAATVFRTGGAHSDVYSCRAPCGGARSACPGQRPKQSSARLSSCKSCAMSVRSNAGACVYCVARRMVLYNRGIYS